MTEPNDRPPDELSDAERAEMEKVWKGGAAWGRKRTSQRVIATLASAGVFILVCGPCLTLSLLLAVFGGKLRIAAVMFSFIAAAAAGAAVYKKLEPNNPFTGG